MWRLLLVLVIACGGSSKSSQPAAPAKATKILVNVDDQGVILGGNDAISYRKGDAPARGDASVTSTFDTATYRFASADSKAAFDADATHLAPAFGGYCAFAASQGRLSPSDPSVFVIQDGQLLVFTNEDFRAQFMADPAGNKRKAEQAWPRLVEQYGK